ncbi:MAG: efflux RND transporter periplasmic adaptor subunit [Bacillota bacterium]
MAIDQSRRWWSWSVDLAGSIVIGVLAMLLQGCKRDAGAPPSRPPVVSVSRPLQQVVADWDEYPGRLAATDTVDLRARVGGFIEQANFDEGVIVNQGDVLFVIDVRPYQADLDRAEASLAQAQAQQRYAASEFARIEPLQKTGAVAELQYLNARQALETANAAIASAQAAVETARLNVEWCRVTAPIRGRVGRKLVTPGNLITGGTAQGTLLTTIVTLDPIYCYADVDERTVLIYQQLVRERARPSGRSNVLPAQLAVGDQPDFRYQGHIDFVNNVITPGTGTISIRGVFANHDGRLLSGFYARMRILRRAAHEALLVPEEAVGSTLAQRYVLVVGSDGVVQYRQVTPGKSFGNLREVEGISPTDRIVVNGLVNVRPGARVQVQEVPIAEVAQTQPARGEAAQGRATTGPTRPEGLGQRPSRSSGGAALEGAGTPGVSGTRAGATGGGAAGMGSAGGGGGGGRP